MTQENKQLENKQLLLRELCARLPYGVIVEIEDEPQTPVQFEWQHLNFIINWEWTIKPYLRPMSSMTEEEKRELLKYGAVVRLENAEVADVSCTGFDRHAEVQDWLLAHHFDYRGLIEKGLAIEVTKENNPYKE